MSGHWQGYNSNIDDFVQTENKVYISSTHVKAIESLMCISFSCMLQSQNLNLIKSQFRPVNCYDLARGQSHWNWREQVKLNGWQHVFKRFCWKYISQGNSHASHHKWPDIMLISTKTCSFFQANQKWSASDKSNAPLIAATASQPQ